MTYILSIILGVFAGVFSGFFGIGGAVIIVPVLVYLFKFPQHFAQGTALVALLLPVGALAVYKYYQTGNVSIKIGLLISLGFLIGGFIGASVAQAVPNLVLKRLFGALLLCISIYMLIGK
ncbi:MAG: sulfite exporter TauE/SafE family protein [Candidatus Omnitrophica bacterium]|nr:sulfite exporter TauE/SafE family protein [Candidatus Omnitrophota bacterium]